MTENARPARSPQAASQSSPPSERAEPPARLDAGPDLEHQVAEFETVLADAVSPLHYAVTSPREQWMRDRAAYQAGLVVPGSRQARADCDDSVGTGASGPCWTWSFPVAPAVVGTARDLVSAVLRGWGCTAVVITDVALAASELLTNALRASEPGGLMKVEVVLEAAADGVRVVLGVWDAGSGFPQTLDSAMPDAAAVAEADPAGLEEDRIGGWGLSMVEALSLRWWVRSTSPVGKWVCAAMAAAVSYEDPQDLGARRRE